jgi:hypothetical protein
VTLYVVAQDVKLILDLPATCFEFGRPVLHTHIAALTRTALHICTAVSINLCLELIVLRSVNCVMLTS